MEGGKVVEGGGGGVGIFFVSGARTSCGSWDVYQLAAEYHF
jgi:hypothetical protein